MRREDSFSRSLSRSSYGGFEYASPTLSRESHFKGSPQTSNQQHQQQSRIPSFALQQQQRIASGTSSNGQFQPAVGAAEKITQRASTDPKLLMKSSTMPNISSNGGDGDSSNNNSNSNVLLPNNNEKPSPTTTTTTNVSGLSPQFPASRSTAAPSPAGETPN